MARDNFSYYSKPKKWRNISIILIITVIAFFIYHSLKPSVSNEENSIEELTIPIPAKSLPLENLNSSL